MDKKSEEELERIANLVTAEMVRSLNTPKSEQDLDNEDLDEGDEGDTHDRDDESRTDDERDHQPPGKPRA